MNKKVSANLRRLLKERGMTQEKLSAMTGLSKAAISNIVNGKLGEAGPRADSLDLICTALGVPKEELYADIEEPAIADAADALRQAKQRNAELEEQIDEKDEAIMSMVHQLELLRTAIVTSNERFSDSSKYMRKAIMVLAIALIVTVILLIGVSFYAGFSYFAFDVLDPSKGLYKG